MFTTSAALLIGYLLAYSILPRIPGVLMIHLVSRTRLHGRLLHMMSRFVGVGVIGYGLFLLQFVRFGIDRIAYAILIVALLVALAVRMRFSHLTIKELLHTRRCDLSIRSLHDSWKKAGNRQRIFTVLVGLCIIAFIVTTFIFVTHFPSYADDAFGNRHLPVINMVYDGGAKIFGQAGEILGRGRLGYPVMIPMMQAFIARVMGGYNDIYINIFPRLATFFFMIICITTLYKKTKNILRALIGPALIISLPLIFLHTVEGYMDFLSAIYTALAIMSLYSWLQDDGHTDHLLLGITFLSILSYVKNDGFVVYMTGVLVAALLYFILYRKTTAEKLHTFRKPTTWFGIIAIILFFIIPFTFIKSYYHLGFNQAAGANAGLGLASTIHREIFPAIRKIMRAMNNYSVAPLLMLLIIIALLYTYKKIEKQKIFLLLAPIVILLFFIAVFLFTENYKFVLDQTTVNRVFTMVLVIFFSYSALLVEIAE